ncbi:MAG: quinolinate synthase NadA [Armatimonadota bacterium]
MATMLERLRSKLTGIVPDAELVYKSEIAEEIMRVKAEKNAVILAHNYMEPALYYSIPDYTGDSLGLSRDAAKVEADIIVFCGVKFMAETAKILNPNKKVLLPADKAGCSLAESITAEDVRNLRVLFPGVPVVTYVNTYADVKAESDICCTSGNAAAVVRSLNSDTIIFLPDKYLATNVAKQTGKSIILPHGGGKFEFIGKGDIIGWNGACEVHEKFTVEDIINARKQFEGVVILAHPECPADVCDASDFSGSTTEMVEYVRKTKAHRYLLLTECSMGDNIAAENPDKEMVRYCSIRCPHMNLITLEDTLKCLQTEQVDIVVPEEIRIRAYSAVERMINIG